MSEIKFACPVCGQHITCASGSSGSPMACPTCFRQLIVPQATAPGVSNLVLTASEVQSRPISLPGNGNAAVGRVVPAKRFPWAGLALGLVICAVLAAAFVFRGRIIQAYQQGLRVETNSLASGAKSSVDVSPSADAASKWTLNLATTTIPETPAAGQINGQSFALQRATVKGGLLVLGRGTKWPPDMGMAVDFFARHAEDLAGKTVIIEADRTKAPRVIVRWQDEQGQTVTQEFTEGYALRVEFGPLTDRRLPGKIYLAAPDEGKSYLAGTFDAEIRKP